MRGKDDAPVGALEVILRAARALRHLRDRALPARESATQHNMYEYSPRRETHRTAVCSAMAASWFRGRAAGPAGTQEGHCGWRLLRTSCWR